MTKAQFFVVYFWLGLLGATAWEWPSECAKGTHLKPHRWVYVSDCWSAPGQANLTVDHCVDPVGRGQPQLHLNEAGGDTVLVEITGNSSQLEMCCAPVEPRIKEGKYPTPLLGMSDSCDGGVPQVYLRAYYPPGPLAPDALRVVRMRCIYRTAQRYRIEKRTLEFPMIPSLSSKVIMKEPTCKEMREKYRKDSGF
nr:hypothetical protein [Salmonid herpesvirus 1]UNP64432.1 hypothetical protein [Salmonid herpesvirus 1]